MRVRIVIIIIKEPTVPDRSARRGGRGQLDLRGPRPTPHPGGRGRGARARLLPACKGHVPVFGAHRGSRDAKIEKKKTRPTTLHGLLQSGPLGVLSRGTSHVPRGDRSRCALFLENAPRPSAHVCRPRRGRACSRASSGRGPEHGSHGRSWRDRSAGRGRGRSAQRLAWGFARPELPRCHAGHRKPIFSVRAGRAHVRSAGRAVNSEILGGRGFPRKPPPALCVY